MKKITKRLGEIPTLYYVLIYLLLIFIFATIYYFIPNRSFYHSTSKFEYSDLNEDADNILNSVKDCIINSNIDFYGDSIINLSGWEIHINQININSLSVDNFPKDIGFRMSFSLKHDNGIITVLSPNIRIDLQEKIIVRDLILCTVLPDYESIAIIDTIKTPDINSFFQVSTDKGMYSLKPTLTLTSDLWNDIIYFGQGYRGFPNRQVSGQWFRMLYLSAGVATSTIIGDIVPLTILSRFLITIQGLLTIIVISLFFNALAYDISFILDESKGKNERIKNKKKNKKQ